MRLKALHSFWLATALTSCMVLGGESGEDPKKAIQTKEVTEATEATDGLEMYFRDGDLLALTSQELPVYPETKTGESKSLGRDFPDAPPQIPHTVEDMYPITLDDNECLDCHHPDNAISKEDVPVPESHFRAAVMGKGKPDDAMLWVVTDYKQLDDLVGARYNCNMCHTPQATNVRTPNNRFMSARNAQK